MVYTYIPTTARYRHRISYVALMVGASGFYYILDFSLVYVLEPVTMCVCFRLSQFMLNRQ